MTNAEAKSEESQDVDCSPEELAEEVGIVLKRQMVQPTHPATSVVSWHPVTQCQSSNTFSHPRGSTLLRPASEGPWFSCQEGVAKSQFLLEAVVFKSQPRI